MQTTCNLSHRRVPTNFSILLLQLHKLLKRSIDSHLHLLAKEIWWLGGIAHLNSQSCLSMSTVSNKTKAFVSLDSDLFNHSSTKRMEVAMEIELSDLQINTQQHPINFHDYYKVFGESAKSFCPFSKKSFKTTWEGLHREAGKSNSLPFLNASTWIVSSIYFTAYTGTNSQTSLCPYARTHTPLYTCITQKIKNKKPVGEEYGHLPPEPDCPHKL